MVETVVIQTGWPCSVEATTAMGRTNSGAKGFVAPPVR